MEPLDLSGKWPPPRKQQPPGEPAPEEIVMAEFAEPRYAPPQIRAGFPAQSLGGVKANSEPDCQSPRPYDWKAMAVFSWVIPLIVGVLSVLAILLNGGVFQYSAWWIPVGFLWLVGVLCFVVPFKSRGARDRRSTSRGHATVGLLFSLLALVWMGLCEMLILGVQHAKTPAGRRAIAARRAELQKQAQQAARKRQEEIQEERRRTEPERREKARQAEISASQKEAVTYIPIRDEYLAHRLQHGEGLRNAPTPPRAVPGRDPLPLFSARPAETMSFRASPISSEMNLSGPWWFADGLKVQALKIPGLELVPQAIWPKYKEGNVFLLTKAGHLLEVSTKDWRVLRDTDLEGTCVGMAMSKDGLVVARSEPGALLLIPMAGNNVTVFPIAHLAEVAAGERSSLVAVRTSRRPGELAVLNLASRQILYILDPQEAVRVGRGRDAIENPDRTYSELKKLHISADGGHLLGLGDQLYHWTIKGDALRFVESTREAAGRNFGVSQDGRYVATGNGVYFVHDLKTQVYMAAESYLASHAAVDASTAWLYTTDHRSKLKVYDGQGHPRGEYHFQEQGNPQIHGLALAPTGQQAIVFRTDWPYLALDLGSSPLAQVGSVARAPQQLQTTPGLGQKGWELFGELAKPRFFPPTHGIEVLHWHSHNRHWCWSADGEKLFAADHSSIRRINAASLREERAVNLNAPPGRLRLTGAGLVAVATPCRLTVLDPETLDVLRVIDAPDATRGAEDRQELLATSAGSPYLFAVSGSGGIEMIDLRDGRLVSEIYPAELCGRQHDPTSSSELDKVAGLALTRDGKHLIATMEGVHRLAVTDQGVKYEQGTQRMFKPPAALLSGDSRLILAPSSDQDSRQKEKHILYEIGNLQKPLRVLRGKLPLGPDVRLDETGDYLWGQDFQLIDTHTMEARKLELPMVRGRNLLLAPHGKRALVAGDTEFLLLNLTKRDFSPSAAAFAPLIEKSTVTAGQDFRITEDEQSVVGEVQEQDGAKFHTLTIKPSAEPEDTVVFSADGEWMFVPQLGEETTIHQISLPDLKQRRTLAIPKAGSCKLMYAAGAIGIWSSNKNELWLVDERDLQVKQVFRMLDRKPFATAPDAPLLFIYAEQLFVVDLQSGQTLEGCDLKALADQVPTRKGSFPLEIHRPLRVSGDGKEIYARSRLLRWDGKQITLDLDHSVFNADGRIVWNRTHKEWRALAVIPTLTGEESQVGYYNSMSPRHRVATLDLSSNRMPDIFFLPGDTDAFGVPGTRNRLELYRLSDGKRESYSMPNRFSIDTIFPAASGRQALVIGSRQLVWAEFPVVLGDPPR